MKKILLVLVCGMFPVTNGLADVTPEWTTPNNMNVLLPPSGSTSIDVSGNVIGGFFDVMLIFDTSSSMGGVPFPFGDNPPAPNGGVLKLDWAKSAAEEFTTRLDDRIRMGLMEFNTDPTLQSGLVTLGSDLGGMTQRELLIETMNGFSAQGGTDLSTAIDLTADVFDFDSASSTHMVLLTDASLERLEYLQSRVSIDEAIDAGLDSFNVLGLPNINEFHAADFARRGRGVFVNSEDSFDTLVDDFASVLDRIEILEQLDIILPDGTVIENVTTDLNGNFTVSGDIFAGTNIFTARATSSTGEIRFAELRVNGIAIPEPSTAGVLFFAIGLIATRLRKR